MGEVLTEGDLADDPWYDYDHSMACAAVNKKYCDSGPANDPLLSRIL